MSMKPEEGEIVRKDGRVYVGYRLPNGRIVLALDPDSYQDIVSMPDPIIIGFGSKILNYTTATLWFTIEGSGGGWSWASATELGSIAPGSNKKFRVGAVATRAKPASATTDNVTLIFTAYSDEYITEAGTYPVIVSYHWIDSDAMALLDLDDFDDATLQGWAQNGDWGSFGLATNYVLSSDYSAYAYRVCAYSSYNKPNACIYKSFAVPAADEAYLICNVKYATWFTGGTGSTAGAVREVRIQKGAEVLVRTGDIPYLINTTGAVYLNWIRMVAPISVDETAEYRLVTDYYVASGHSARYRHLAAWYDNLKVVYA